MQVLESNTNLRESTSLTGGGADADASPGAVPSVAAPIVPQPQSTAVPENVRSSMPLIVLDDALAGTGAEQPIDTATDTLDVSPTRSGHEDEESNSLEVFERQIRNPSNSLIVPIQHPLKLNPIPGQDVAIAGAPEEIEVDVPPATKPYNVKPRASVIDLPSTLTLLKHASDNHYLEEIRKKAVFYWAKNPDGSKIKPEELGHPNRFLSEEVRKSSHVLRTAYISVRGMRSRRQHTHAMLRLARLRQELLKQLSKKSCIYAVEMMDEYLQHPIVTEAHDQLFFHHHDDQMDQHLRSIGQTLFRELRQSINDPTFDAVTSFIQPLKHLLELADRSAEQHSRILLQSRPLSFQTLGLANLAWTLAASTPTGPIAEALGQITSTSLPEFTTDAGLQPALIGACSTARTRFSPTQWKSCLVNLNQLQEAFENGVDFTTFPDRQDLLVGMKKLSNLSETMQTLIERSGPAASRYGELRRTLDKTVVVTDASPEVSEYVQDTISSVIAGDVHARDIKIWLVQALWTACARPLNSVHDSGLNKMLRSHSDICYALMNEDDRWIGDDKDVFRQYRVSRAVARQSLARATFKHSDDVFKAKFNKAGVRNDPNSATFMATGLHNVATPLLKLCSCLHSHTRTAAAAAAVIALLQSLPPFMSRAKIRLGKVGVSVLKKQVQTLREWAQEQGLIANEGDKAGEHHASVERIRIDEAFARMDGILQVMQSDRLDAHLRAKVPDFKAIQKLV